MAPTGYSNSGYSSNSGLSSRNNGFGRVGGSFQSNRGSLTKLSGGITRASSIGGTATGISNVTAKNVPKPINTSSLRKENGGQDISTVLVNRQGGKVGWGSSLPDKNDEHGDKPQDPTPEETVLKTGELKNPVDLPRKEISTNTSPSHYDTQQAHGSTSPKMGSKNTPWALHPPNPSRDNLGSEGDHPSHGLDRRSHHQPHLDQEDVPRLQDETLPYSEYDRTGYKVDRYHQDPYDREYGGSRINRYYPHGVESNRDEMLYRPATNSYRRYSNQEGNPIRDSRDYNSRHSSQPDQRTYERDRDRLYERAIPNDGYNKDVNDRNYNHTNYERFYPPRSDLHDRRHEQSSYQRHGQEYSSDNRRSVYSRGTDEEHHERHAKYEYSLRESNADTSRPRPYHRSHSDIDRSSRFIEDDTPTRFRDFVRNDRVTQGNHGSSELSSRVGSRTDDSQRNDHRFFPNEPLVNNNRSTSTVVSASSIHNPSPIVDKNSTHETNRVLPQTEKPTPSEPLPVQNASTNLRTTIIKDDNVSPQENSYGKEKDAQSKTETTASLKLSDGVVTKAKDQMKPLVRVWDDDDDSESSKEDKAHPIMLNVDTEQQRLNQQQMILQRVQAVRDMRKKTAKTEDNKIDIEQTQRQLIQTQKPLVSNRKDKVVVAEKSDSNKTEKSDANERLEKEKSKESLLAIKRDSERTARLEHRRTRKPRTRGVLFKRLDDGTIVNADLSESEQAKRRKGKHADQKDTTSGDAKMKFGRGIRKSGTNLDESSSSIISGKENQNGIIDRFRVKKQRETNTVPENDDVKTEKKGKNSALSKNSGVPNSSLSENERIKQSVIPEVAQNSPPVSAWLSGPPSSIFHSADQPNANLLMIDSEKEHKKGDLIKAHADDLSSTLLTSWSTKNTSNSMVAKGPIISTWSTLSNDNAGLYQPFHSKQDSTPVAAADWSMDFALPRDLLSPTAEDNEDPLSHDKQNHDSDPIAITSNPSSEQKNGKISKRTFAPNRKKSRIASSSNPNESVSRTKSTFRRIPNAPSQTKGSESNHPTFDSDRKPKSNTRRAPNRNKVTKTES